ncbi:methyl-accepting chemotaxis protein [Halorhodospira abdelmalekii]|uniref:methyl-accepting chemotaxis protein n=1 Tax=Halorhodospira abdelmalekii TaxID=421629 RepID=UPI00190432DF|nr:methyl-accepting chemotaxis protein [Halorhodospira abdelmalekii]
MLDLTPPSRQDPAHLVKERERRASRLLLEKVRGGSLRAAFVGARLRQIVKMARYNADRQVEIASCIFSASEESSQALTDIARRTEGLSESNRKAVEIARDTGQRLDSASDGLDRAYQRVASFREHVGQLSESSQNIARISEMVHDFSKKTNLLALNAAIEAARAGESGASFTVVAEEVRSLANKVSESNNEIRKTLDQMNALVESASAGAADIAQHTSDAQEVLSQATETFRHLLHDSEHNYAEIEQIGTAMEELTYTNRSIHDNANHIKELGDSLQAEAASSDDSSRRLQETLESNLAQLCRVRTGHGPLEALLERRERSRDRLQEMLESLYAQGADIFDRNYQKVPDTDPPKYRVSYLDAMRQAMQDAIDETIKDFDGASYSTLVDANGYLPVHHRWLSHEPSHNRDTDIARSRHMRLFNALGVEINRARNRQPFLIQINLRDTGEVLGDLALPVFVAGNHWGNLILGFPVEQLFGGGGSSEAD